MEKAIGVNRKLLHDWVNGNATITPDHAWNVGQSLYLLGETRTDGISALYACGYGIEAMACLNGFVVIGESERAVALWTWLPLAFSFLDDVARAERWERVKPGRLDAWLAENDVDPTVLANRVDGKNLTKSPPRYRKLIRDGSLALRSISDLLRPEHALYERAWQARRSAPKTTDWRSREALANFRLAYAGAKAVRTEFGEPQGFAAWSALDAWARNVAPDMHWNTRSLRWSPELSRELIAEFDAQDANDSNLSWFPVRALDETAATVVTRKARARKK